MRTRKTVSALSLVTAAGILAACSADDTNQSPQSAEPEAVQMSSIDLDSGVIVSSGPLEEVEDVTGSYICADVDVTNDSDSTIGVSPMRDWSLIDPDGQRHEQGFTGQSQYAAEQLEPGQGVEGRVCFDVVPSGGQYILSYEDGAQQATWEQTL